MLSKATSGRTLTSDHLYVLFAGRLSPDRMIASGMKACTLAKENSFAKENSNTGEGGGVDENLLALML
jgi:hypothetical protein